MVIDRPESFSDRHVVGTRLLYRVSGNTAELDAGHAFIFSGGVLTDINSQLPPLTFSSQLHSVNDHGRAVGIKSSSAFSYADGVATGIALLPGGSNAFGVNNVGQATGWVIQEGLWLAFLYTPASANSPATMIDLGHLDANHRHTEGAAINDSGHVVGFSTVGAQSDSHGFVYRDGTMTDLGTLGGSSSSAGFISNTDTIVGSSKTADGSDRAVIYSDGRVTDLNSLIDPSDPLATKGFVAATKINEDGVITVIADRNTTNPQRFLLGIELADVPFCIPEIDLSFKVVDVSSLHEQNI